MSLGADEIAAVVAELAPLAGSRVDEVRVHAERALTLGLFGRAGPATLLVSAEADLTRLHAAERRPPSPPSPFPFQAPLRRELLGARLASVEPVPGDRVVALRFERDGEVRSLVAELTGRHGNLFLLDAAGTILASAARNLSRRRRLVAGEPWVPPAPREAEAAAPPRLAPVAGARFPLSAAVETRYLALEEERALAEARRRLREPLRAAAARGRRALDRLAGEAARVPAAEADRRVADLLKANLHALPRGAREARLVEYTAEGTREVTVALDPAVAPRENMERWYRRYRRIVESAARVGSRTEEVRARLAGIEALLAEVEAAGLADLARLEREARRAGAAPRPPPAPRRDTRRAEARPPPPYRAFRSASGAAIWVGKGAAENDAVTFRLAKGNDAWLHARGRAGAHVVLRLDKGKGPDQEGLLDAAHLATHFSDARGDPSCEVVWTRVKWVRKPRGAAPGAVAISQERALFVRIEPARIERLLAGAEEPGEAP